jgi:hypothetical protein
MITIEPERMNGPPSLRCQCGGLARSTSRPRGVFQKRGSHATGGSGWLALIQAFSASSGSARIDAERQRRALRRSGGVGEARARGRNLDAVEQQRRAFGVPAATSVMPPSSNAGRRR